MTAPATSQPAPPSTAQRAAEAAALRYAYQQATQAIRAHVEGFVTAVWRSLGFYSDAQLPQFLELILPFIAGAQQQMATLTAAHLAHQQSAVLGVPFQPVALDPKLVSGAAVRNGTRPADVYSRPFHLVWRQLAELPHEPGSIDKAVKAGEDRAVQTALTDVQLAKTHASQQTLAHDGHVVGYRRVLEGAYSCGLCIVAATVRYRKGELLPVHPACDCSVDPLYGTEDPGKYVDPMARDENGRLHVIGELGDVHQAIKDRFGRSSSAGKAIPGAKDGKGRPVQYRDALIVHHHGELGPVLGVRGAGWTGPSDLHK